MTSFFDYFIGYTVSLHVEVHTMMKVLDTFEGGEPRFLDPRAVLAQARCLEERRQQCFGQPFPEDSHATGYGFGDSAAC